MCQVIFDKLLEMKGESSVNHVPIILVANMRDLHPRRVISVEEVCLRLIVNYVLLLCRVVTCKLLILSGMLKPGCHACWTRRDVRQNKKVMQFELKLV